MRGSRGVSCRLGWAHVSPANRTLLCCPYNPPSRPFSAPHVATLLSPWRPDGLNHRSYDAEHGDLASDRVPREVNPPVARPEAVLGGVGTTEARHVALANGNEQLQRLTHAAPDDRTESAEIFPTGMREDEIIAAPSAHARPRQRRPRLPASQHREPPRPPPAARPARLPRQTARPRGALLRPLDIVAIWRSRPRAAMWKPHARSEARASATDAKVTPSEFSG